MPNDDISKNDLRRRINHRKILISFYYGLNQKEIEKRTPGENFMKNSSLIVLLIVENFLTSNSIYVHSNYSNIKKSSFFPTDEFLYADIYELKWDSDDQEAEFKRLAYSKSDDYIFATRDEIMNGFTAQGKKILPHSKKLFKN